MSEPTITQIHHRFWFMCAVEIRVHAPTVAVWKLLTDAERFPQWNSTVTRIEGRISDGERLRLHVPGTRRTFTPRVRVLKQNEYMTWTGGFAPLFVGERTFMLTPRVDGSTRFAMQERFSGLMLPLIRRSLPDFGPVFATFARDLKREAERESSEHVRYAPAPLRRTS